MLEVAARVVLEVMCGLTGHLVLRALTLGRWDISNGRDDAAALVGILFWVTVGAGIWLAFFR
jgi:hypothetical protein